ncbi:MAG: DEAD/DEAH box helicase, partial [Proteobacteria bacterium]
MVELFVDQFFTRFCGIKFERFQNGQVRIMIATDLAARGIDLKDVKHVIMFDFPLNIIDFLHRAGRTGRLDAASGVLVQHCFHLV